MIPLLTIALEFPIKDAIFLSLCSIFLLSLISNIKYRTTIRSHRELIRGLAFFVIGGAIISAIIGSKSAPFVLDRAFSIVLIILSIFYLFDRSSLLPKSSQRSPQWSSRGILLAGGCLSGFFGLGGGILFVPMLNKLQRIPMNLSVQLSFCFVFLSSSTALLTQYHQRAEEIYGMPPLPILCLLLGTFIGSLIATRVKVSALWLRRLFCVVLLGTGAFKLLMSF